MVCSWTSVFSGLRLCLFKAKLPGSSCEAIVFSKDDRRKFRSQTVRQRTRRKSEEKVKRRARKEMQVRESREQLFFFQWFVAQGGRRVGSLKRRRSNLWELGIQFYCSQLSEGTGTPTAGNIISGNVAASYKAASSQNEWARQQLATQSVTTWQPTMWQMWQPAFQSFTCVVKKAAVQNKHEADPAPLHWRMQQGHFYMGDT